MKITKVKKHDTISQFVVVSAVQIKSFPYDTQVDAYH
jgi:hypothetical protein